MREHVWYGVGYGRELCGWDCLDMLMVGRLVRLMKREALGM